MIEFVHSLEEVRRKRSPTIHDAVFRLGFLGRMQTSLQNNTNASNSTPYCGNPASSKFTT